MSFGSAMRFEVKDGGKGGIFWQKEKPKEKTRKFGYKSKGLRHPIRKPEEEYIEEPKEKPKPGKDFIRKNREQYKKARPEEDKENERGYSRGSGGTSSSIKPGTVTLTQDQLNALLATVGKLKHGEGSSNIRISIDAENNRLEFESPRDNMDSAPNSSRSEAGNKDSRKEDISILQLTKNNNADDQKNTGSYGVGSGDKSGGGKEVRFDTSRNEERQKTPEATPAPPPLVPWRHMTVAERKRLQWAREREAEEQLQKQRNFDPWGRPGGGAPTKPPEEQLQKQRNSDPWGRPGDGAPTKPPEPEPKIDDESKLTETERLQKAIDAIEAKYGDLLNPPENQKQSSDSTDGRPERKRGGEDGGKSSSSLVIPGLDSSYAISKDPKESSQPRTSKQRESGQSKASKRLEDRGNSRPPRRPDRRDPREERKSRGEERKETRKTERRQDEERGDRRREGAREDGRQRDGQREEEGGGGPRAASSEAPAAAPAAMQTSLFIGQSEPDTSQFLSKKEEEKKRWLEELDRQREEKRLQKQREKEKQREGVDDTWADRFVAPSSRPPPQAQPHPQQHQQQPPPTSYAAPSGGGGAWERSSSQPQSYSADPDSLPPAAMRSAMTIGNVAPNLDKIQQRQAEEKRLWLEELNKQREEQREARMKLKDKQRASEETWANRFTQDPRTVAAEANPQRVTAPYEPPSSQYKDSLSSRVGSAPQPAVNDSLEQEGMTFLRGQNVHMDPVTRKELEDKRRKHLEYQAAIKAQIEEKERQKREERERKWREEMEGERKLQAERDALQRQLEAETNKTRQKEEARQRQVEQLKNLIDAEQEKAQEERMKKRLTTLQQAGHDVTGLRAHYEAITPRLQQASLDPATIPGLGPTSWDSQGAGNSPRVIPVTYRASEGPPSVQASQEFYSQGFSHEPYTENRVLTPSRFRQPGQPRTFPASPQREFATQTGDDEELGLSQGLRKELSDVEIEYRGRRPTSNTNTTTAAAKDSRNARSKSGERRKAAENVRGKPPPSKQNRQKAQKQQKGKSTTWNYQNPQQKAPVKQSEKDLFYEQKRQESEERRVKRERQLQYLVELNKQVIPTERQARPHHPDTQDLPNGHSDYVDGEQVQREGRSLRQGHRSVVNGDVSHRSRSPPVNRNGKYRPSDRSRSPPVPTVRRKTGHNPAKDYETDYDTEAHSYYRPSRGLSPTLDERGNIQVPTKETDFIPFTRTNDVLDPSKAEDPLHLSREQTRIQQARQHYHENLRPADYGNPVDIYRDDQRQPAARAKDPILNPGLVRDHPTARQDQILQQLSSLKQSLIQRRREIETCMSPSDLEK